MTRVERSRHLPTERVRLNDNQRTVVDGRCQFLHVGLGLKCAPADFNCQVHRVKESERVKAGVVAEIARDIRHLIQEGIISPIRSLHAERQPDRIGFGVVPMHKLLKSPEIDRSAADLGLLGIQTVVMKHVMSVEHGMQQRAFPDAVGAEEQGDRPDVDFQRFPDSLEILDDESGNHLCCL